MKHPEQTYIEFDPYADDCDVEYRKVKLVKTRKEHDCFPPSGGELHKVPAGTTVRFESAMVDGEWGRYYTCLDCIDAYIEEFDL